MKIKLLISILNIFKNLFITFFQKFNSIIANLAINKNFENFQKSATFVLSKVINI